MLHKTIKQIKQPPFVGKNEQGEFTTHVPLDFSERVFLGVKTHSVTHQVNREPSVSNKI